MTYRLTPTGIRYAWVQALSDAEFETGLTVAEDPCLIRALEILASRHGEAAVDDLITTGTLPERLKNAAASREYWAHSLSRAVFKSRDLRLPGDPERALRVLTTIHQKEG